VTLAVMLPRASVIGGAIVLIVGVLFRALMLAFANDR
jgi:hypothetical protein